MNKLYFNQNNNMTILKMIFKDLWWLKLIKILMGIKKDIFTSKKVRLTKKVLKSTIMIKRKIFLKEMIHVIIILLR